MPGWYKLELLGIPLYLGTFLSNGWLAVNLFFILSGFVLYLPFVKGSRSFANASDVKNFYISRIRRLAPLYYFNLFICLIFVTKITLSKLFFTNLISYLLFTFNYSTKLFFPKPNWVMWSLGIEVWFSVIFPILVVTIKRYGMLKNVIAVMLLSLIVRMYGVLNPIFSVNVYLSIMRDSIIGRLDDFVLGMVLAHFYVHKDNLKLILTQHKVTSGLLGIMGFIFLFIAGNLWDNAATSNRYFYIPFINNVVQIAFVLIISTGLFFEASFFNKLFSNNFLTWIGTRSYSFYLWHGVLIAPVIAQIYSVSSLSTYIILLTIVVYLSYRYIETAHN